MEISAFVAILVVAVVVDCTPMVYDEKPMSIYLQQIMNQNKNMSDCPIRSQSRVHGKCQCPNEYPSQTGSYCCVREFGVVSNCDCPRSHVFKRNTRQLCYEMNTRDYTITVDGVSMCQDENLKTKDGLYCCVVNGNRKKICHCPQGKTYDHVANRCVKRVKITFQ